MTIISAHLVNRGTSFQICWSDSRGRYMRKSAGKDLKQANLMLMKFNEWLFEGKDPWEEWMKYQRRETISRITLSDFFQVFMDRHARHLSKSMQDTWPIYMNNIRRASVLADAPLSEVSRKLVRAYMDARIEQDSVSNATANREAALIKSMLSRAVEWEYINSNPLAGMRLLPEKQKREVDVTQEDAARLLDSLSPALANIVEFAIYTGLRKENILSLEIKQVRLSEDGLTGEVRVLAKGNKYQTFPLNRPAVEVFKRASAGRKDGFVFLNPVTKTRYISVNRTIDRHIRDVGLEVDGTKLRFHDLRHVFATWLHEQGVSLDVLRSLMGHSKRATTDRYTTVKTDTIRKGLNLMPSIERKKK